MTKATNARGDVESHEVSELAVRGQIDEYHDRRVCGWAAIGAQSAERLGVELLIDGVSSAKTVADQFRADLEFAGIGDGRYGFELIVPLEFCDGESHKIEVREMSTGLLLDGGPLTFSERAPSQPESATVPVGGTPTPTFVTGFLDECLPTGLTGWAARIDGSSAPVEVELLIDGLPAARILADLHRADLESSDVGGGTGRHGFRLPVPDRIFDNQPHEIRVREVSTREVLGQGVRLIAFNPCDLWNVSEGNPRRRRLLAEAALTFCEVAPDEAFREEVHRILLRMSAWLAQEGNSRNGRRVQALLDRYTARCCRILITGLVNLRQIAGRFSVTTSGTQVVELELIEQDGVSPDITANPRTTTQADGSFVFTLPETWLNDQIHTFLIRVVPLGGILGEWSFYLSANARHRDHFAWRLSLDPIWDTVPAALAMRNSHDALSDESDAERLRLELEDAIALEIGDGARSAEIVALRCELARHLMTIGEYAAALNEFEKAAATDSECIAACVGQVRCLLATGDLQAAEARLAILRISDPDAREFYVLDDEIRAHRYPRQVRVVAFYLPQFHPTPENNAWWGEGFTEWSNVAAATPLFAGHLQPRRPTSLGYYDLRLPAAANAQFELARRYGIDGFCYYYYWFGGRRILERPLDDLVSGRTGPFPFCVCWANEPWTRSWDGSTGEVLLAQNHTPESDFQFIVDLAPLLRHPDYIRIDGKPVVMIYRAEKLATPSETVARWREWCRTENIGELHLCAVQSFGFHDPRPFGFDAAVEFPPHCPATVYPDYDFHQEVSDLKQRVEGFKAKVFSYQVFANGDMKTPREPFTLHRSAMVAWDNTARRQKAAHVFHEFSVATFERWVLNNARRAATEQPDGLCFINAWNEWAEGSVMEPDDHFGYEILEAARRAKRLANFDATGTFWQRGSPLFPESRLVQRERIVLVGHDGFRSGAQTNLLNMAWSLKRDLGMDVVIMLIDGGDLVEEYERVAPTYLIGRQEGWQAALRMQLRRYKPLGASKAICNTAVTGEVTEVLKQEGYKVASLIHELPALIESYNLGSRCWTLAASADSIVFASRLVADEFCSRYWPAKEKVAIAAQGIKFNRYHDEREAVRAAVLAELKLPPSSLIVLGCGHGDTRKGIDLFVQMAAEVARQCESGHVAFVWVGALEWQLAPYIQTDITRLGLSDVFRVTGLTTDPARYFISGDIFALTSREDPFPSVVMEAFDAKLPVVAFNGGGGYVEIVNENTGALSPYLDVPALAQAVLAYVRDSGRRTRVGQSNHAIARHRFGYDQYLRKVLALLSDVPAEQVTAGLAERRAWFSDQPRPTISVIIPNFNYARHLELRLKSVIEQTLTPDEIIVLDDASTDGSVALIQEIALRSKIPLRLITNERNTGNPFVQWAKGLATAQGELVWIAEADDYCEPTLLETLVRQFTDDSIVMAWTDSVMVDEQGKSHGATYKDYFARNYGPRWYMNFRTPGRRLIDDCLFAENVVPNASAVVFRRAAVKRADLELMQQYRFSGDWWFWLGLAQSGEVAYCSDPLNYHRRHSRSVMGDVLRAGGALLPEMMSFFGRVAEHKPDCLSHESAREALQRLNRLYDGFADLRNEATTISHHPQLSIQYHELVRALAGAAKKNKKSRGSDAILVLSHDVIAEQRGGAALVRRLDATRSLAALIVVASDREALAFADSLSLPDLPVRVVAPEDRPVAATESPLREAIDGLPRGRIITHGLLAHCLMASIGKDAYESWTVVGGDDFDALLGFPPKDPGVTIAKIHDALSLCTEARHAGKSPPHAFARIVGACGKPMGVLQLARAPRSRHKRLSQKSTVRLLGIGAHARPSAWKEVSRTLAASKPDLKCTTTLLLLSWGSCFEELRQVLRDTPNVKVVHIFDLPENLSELADALLVPDHLYKIYEQQRNLDIETSSMRVLSFASRLTASSHEESLDPILDVSRMIGS